VLRDNSAGAKCITDSIAISVDAGATANFWLHNWTWEMPLKLPFPRLFDISLDQSKVIASVGFWDSWNWRLNFM